ncbi:hypothetical protein ACFQDN_21995 [Pseudomonas asuensis]
MLPSQSLYIPDDEKQSVKLKAHINRFLQIERPSFERLPLSAKKKDGKDLVSADYIYAQLIRSEKPYFPNLDDPILSAVNNAAAHLNNIQNDPMRAPPSPVVRGIVLFEAARKAMQEAEAGGRTGYMHEPRYDDPYELMPVGDEDIPDDAYDE